MTRRAVLFYALALTAMGAGWGVTQPLSKIAVSTGYGHFGLVFWQQVIGAAVMATVCALRGRMPRVTRARLVLWLVVAMIGTVLPNSLSYSAAVHLPAGIMSLLISTVPMFAFVIALGMGNDHFRWRRVIGLAFGLIGVLMIVAPAVDLGQDIPVVWGAAYLLVALFYGLEGNYVSRFGTEGLDPLEVMLGASILGAAVTLPAMLASGQTIAPVWPLPDPQRALIAGSLVHVFVYAAYVWMVGRAGAVFAAQVSYLVTGFGLLWAWLILSEGYAPTLWLALAAMFLGMYFVQPRPRLAQPPPIGQH